MSADEESGLMAITTPESSMAWKKIVQRLGSFHHCCPKCRSVQIKYLEEIDELSHVECHRHLLRTRRDSGNRRNLGHAGLNLPCATPWVALFSRHDLVSGRCKQ